MGRGGGGRVGGEETTPATQVTCNTDTDGRPALLVAQPGGAFMKIRWVEV